MKRMWQITVAILLILSLGMTTLSVSAADDLLGTVVDGSLLTDDDSAEGIVYPKMRGSLLSYGIGGISIAGTRRVSLTGSTAAYRKVARVQVTMYLQRLKNGSWVHVLIMGPKIKYNANTVSNSNTYSVDGGYYYRVHGAHTVIDGSTTESSVSNSDGIWVS